MKKITRSTPITLKSGNIKITDTKAIANELNNYFANIGFKLAQQIPAVDTYFDAFLRQSPCSSLALFPVTYIEIEDEIDNLNSSKATGPYSIPTKLLKTLK